MKLWVLFFYFATSFSFSIIFKFGHCPVPKVRLFPHLDRDDRRDSTHPPLIVKSPASIKTCIASIHHPRRLYNRVQSFILTLGLP